MTNIFKIYDNEMLKSFIKKKSANKHIVLTVLPKNYDENVKKMIFKFMKKKSDMYKNVYFVLYLLDDNNIDSVVKKFNIKPYELPYILYLYDSNQKLVDVTVVTTLKPMKESFSVMEEYYR